MIVDGGCWLATAASVLGASHVRNGRPNQDAVRAEALRGTVSGLAVAVSDGHGGDRYVRSDIGSRLAVEVACDAGQAASASLGGSPAVVEVERHLAGPTASAIVAGWRERVTAHLASNPWTVEERERVDGVLDADPMISYGCTLLVAVLAERWSGMLQIGDGDITEVRGGRGGAPVPDDPRLVGNETTSLCLPSAVDDARVAAGVGDPPDLLILTSDGYANSFESEGWREDIGADLAAQVRRDGLTTIERRLPAWLDESAVASGDDVSMVLAVRRDLVDGLDGEVTVDRGRRRSSGTEAPDRRRGRRRRRRGGAR